MKVTKYKILSDYCLTALEQFINSHIEDGWQPFGDIKMIDAKYLQVMIMLEKLEEERVSHEVNELLSKRMKIDFNSSEVMNEND